MEAEAAHGTRWRHRYAIFDSYADLVTRGLCSLPEAVDAYLYEIGVPAESRRILVAGSRSCDNCRGLLAPDVDPDSMCMCCQRKGRFVGA